MLSIEAVRHEPDVLRRSLQARREDVAVVEELVRLDGERRALVAEVEGLRAEAKRNSKAVGEAMKAGDAAAADGQRAAGRELGERVKRLEAAEREASAQLRALLLTVPNILAGDVPDGADESANTVARAEGEPRSAESYGFGLKPHWELSEDLGITDLERGSKVAGRMFTVLGEAGARLQRALIAWMLDMHRKSHGYAERAVPYLVLRETMEGSGNLPKFADNLYHDDEDDLWLIPTAEVPLTGLHRDEIIAPGTLPLRYVAHTPCFRREKAAAGTQVRGLKRLHQFDKVEMYQLVEPERSVAVLEEIVEHASDVARGLGLPFRILELCSGDIGFQSAKTYDVEIWSPASAEWLEVSSCSNCTDFQARRANIRFRREQQARPEFVHTLNGSGLALPRVIIALLETNQQSDGTVRLPEALVPYMDGQQVLEPVR